MLNRLLVPLDGSPLAERAVPVAARLARAQGGTLVLVRIYAPMPMEFTPEVVARDNGADEHEAHTYLARVSANQDLAGISVERVVLGGATARSILDAVDAYRADMIVMCSHGRSGAARWLLGSVAEHVIRQAPVPVLVLRGDEGTSWASESHSKDHVWCAYVGLDGSAVAESALDPTAHLLRVLAGSGVAEMRLVQVLTPEPPLDDESLDSDRELSPAVPRRVAAQTYLRGLAETVVLGDLAAYDLQVRWAVANGDDVADALVAVAERPEDTCWQSVLPHGGGAREAIAGSASGMTLLALATHGRGGLRRWSFGSVAERVLEHTPLPLLLVRPTAPIGTTVRPSHSTT